MPFITREYYNQLKELKAIERNDWTNIARKSAEVGLRGGKGYTRQQVRNVVQDGYTTIQELVDLVIAYYGPKVEAMKKQREAVKQMKRQFQSA